MEWTRSIPSLYLRARCSQDLAWRYRMWWLLVRQCENQTGYLRDIEKIYVLSLVGGLIYFQVLRQRLW